MNRMRFVKHIVGAALLAASATAFAGEVPFTQASFDQTVSSGRPAVVYLHASWCPTCRVQKPIVDRLSADPKLKQVTIFIADYDAETKLKRELKVTQQSTFVVFRNGHEVARSTGQTQEAAIRTVFEQAL
ncbi:thiol-disulfide isomerase/thioredoxin [Paraburkholderia sp. BL6665CI2N2]|uniref:thioredoxin family protein n=1 Tax=Paraburkholderia sp. BL6665CI2N2 TaxID=1938806 RepID=UPI0010658779|nr:thioredoxin family protein [Paraburkholderia sp. BL6665CI2N2]TDY27097.1 thiol-disulfide isomerase/thioredoxin [Paraburkholderia sp. BL6665CI2N2]